MSLPDARQRHTALRDRLKAGEDVFVSFSDASETPSGHAESELTVKSTDRNTVPKAVSEAISDSRLEVVWCVDANNPDYKRILVR